MQIQYSVIDTLEAFAELQESWDNLLAGAPNASLFLTWEWMFTWWEIYHPQNPGWKLHILVFRDGDSLIGILPLFVSSESIGFVKYKRVGFLGDEVESTDYLDIITSDAYRVYFTENLYSILAEEFSTADLIHFKGILADSIIDQGFYHQNNGSSLRQEFRICPYITLPSSFDDYLSRLSSNFRYNIRRRTKKFLKQPGARLSIISEPERMAETIEMVFDLHWKRAQQKQLDTKFLKEKRCAFHQKCAERLAKKNYVKIFVGEIEGQPVASLYCYEFDNTLFYFQSGFDPDWDKISPGLVIMAYAIQYAIENNLRCFDFMRGNEEYKFNWTNDFYHLYEYYQPLSGKGSMLLKSKGVKEGLVKIARSTTLLK